MNIYGGVMNFHFRDVLFLEGTVVVLCLVRFAVSQLTIIASEFMLIAFMLNTGV